MATSQYPEWSMAPTLKFYQGIPASVLLERYIRFPGAQKQYLVFALETDPDGPSTTPSPALPNGVTLTGARNQWVSWAGGGSANGTTTGILFRCTDSRNDVHKTSPPTPVVIGGQQAPLPVQPSSVTAVAKSVSAIDVSWTPGTGGSAAASYKVYRALASNGPFTTVLATVTAPTLTYSDTGLDTGTAYHYCVAMFDVNGVLSAQSVVGSATTFVGAPHTPVNVTAAGTAPDTIRISWVPSTSGPAAVAYHVTAATSSGGVYAQLNGDITTTYFDHTGLSASTERWYQVTALDASGAESLTSAPVNATTWPAAVPATPINVSATALSSSVIRVAWEPGVAVGTSTPVSFRVFQTYKLDYPFSEVANVASSPYDKTGIPPSNTKFYKVVAVDAAGGESGESEIVSATTHASDAPAVPSITSVVAQSQTVLRVTWVAGSGGVAATSYKVYRSDATDGTYTNVGTVTAPTLTYDNTGLTVATQYFYKVTALAGAVESARSSAVPGTTSAALTPSTPGSVVATGMSTTRINVSWIPGAGGSTITGFKVWRGTTSTTNDLIATLGVVTNYNDDTLLAGQQRWYRVSAFDGTSESTKSLADDGTTQTVVVSGVWPDHSPPYLPIVPGGIGGGMDTVAGSGRSASVAGSAGNAGSGTTIRYVDRLDNSGGTGTSGALRTVLDAHDSGSGHSFIVFKVGGVCTPTSTFSIDRGNITVAGHTAPAPGFSLHGGYAKMFVRGNHSLVQHIRIRMGDGAGIAADTRDCFGLNQSGLHHVVLSHCSGAWTVDELMELWGTGWTDITVIDCLFTEPLQNSIHTQPHGYGPAIGGPPNSTFGSFSFFRNILAHASSRHPMSRSIALYFGNNLCFNYGSGTDLQGRQDGSTLAASPHKDSVVNNHYLPAGNPPGTGQIHKPIFLRGNGHIVAGSKFYFDGNIGPGMTSPPVDPWATTMVGYVDGMTAATAATYRVNAPPIAMTGLNLAPATSVRALIVQTAGARPGNRDAVDARTASQVVSGTGSRIDSPSQVGGFPVLATTSVDHTAGADPIPDGLSGRPTPNTIMPSGYTRLEEWSHRREADVL